MSTNGNKNLANQINWYSWNQETFTLAKKMNKPIFLTILKSYCKWSNKLEDDSFTNSRIITILNSHFIPIKINQDERPDIANLYLQLSSKFLNKTGYPLNMILNHHQKPFFMATYLTTESLKLALESILTKWKNSADTLNLISENINLTYPISDDNLIRWDEKIIQEAFLQINRFYDDENGGFFTKPKLLLPHYLLFLLTFYKLTENEDALLMGTETLDKMYYSPTYDHLFGGFFKLSKSSDWLKPIYEKNLLDNSLMATTYLHYYWETKNLDYREIAINIIKFIVDNLYQDNNLFPSSINYLDESFSLTEEKLNLLLSLDEQNLLKKYFDFTFIDKGKTEFTLSIKNNVNLYKIKPTLNKLKNYIQEINPPTINPTINIYENASFITTLIYASTILKDENYFDIAKMLLDSLLAYFNKTKEFKMLILDDYSFLVNTLIKMFNCTNEEKYLTLANDLTTEMIELYYDQLNKNFYLTPYKDDLFLRPKCLDDLNTISGNSLAIYNLIQLKNLTIDFGYDRIIKECIGTLMRNISNSPLNYIFLVYSQIVNTNTYLDILIICHHEEKLKILKELAYHNYQPFAIINFFTHEQIENSQYFNDYESDGNFILYVCEHNSCLDPVIDFDEAIILLKELLL